MTTFIPGGNTNTIASQIPGVIVQNFDAPGSVNPVDVGIIGCVGSAKYGPVGIPVGFSTPQEGAQIWGPVAAETYNMMTFIDASSKVASAYGGSPLYLGVRVTDGTDTAASKDVLDTAGSPTTGFTATAFYTGSYGNNTSVQITTGAQVNTTKVVVSQANNIQATEIYDNIPGTGYTLWNNIVNAINNGQSGVRPSSQLIIASLRSDITATTISAPGSYATKPTVTATIGSGATFNVLMKGVAGTPAVIGTGYLPNDTITLAGGTSTIATVYTVLTTRLATLAVNAGGTGYAVNDTLTLTPTSGAATTAPILTVTAVSSGVITAFTITNRGVFTANSTGFTVASTSGAGTGATFNTALYGVNTVSPTTAGSYSALPTSPVSQASTSGSGSGATFTALWGVLSVTPTAGGANYTPASILQFAGGSGTGGAAGTVSVGSNSAPANATYTLANGTDGNTGLDTDSLLGDDTIGAPTGMYALSNTAARILVLVDVDDTTSFSEQLAFCREQAKFACGVIPIGTTTANAVTLMQAANVFDQDGYFKVMNGDWVYYRDSIINSERLISPQAHWAGLRAIIAPEKSTLNKPLYTVYDTQRSRLNQQYQPYEILQLQNNGIDYIGLPPPGSNLAKNFTCRLGINTSQQPENIDDHVMMLNFFVGFSTGDYLEDYIGELQTDDVRDQASTTVRAFLQDLVSAQRIGNLTIPGRLPYKVVCDSTNNPTPDVEKGMMKMAVDYADNPVIRTIIVNQTRNGTALSVGATTP